jgi:hypothetical protein
MDQKRAARAVQDTIEKLNTPPDVLSEQRRLALARAKERHGEALALRASVARDVATLVRTFPGPGDRFMRGSCAVRLPEAVVDGVPTRALYMVARERVNQGGAVLFSWVEYYGEPLPEDGIPAAKMTSMNDQAGSPVNLVKTSPPEAAPSEEELRTYFSPGNIADPAAYSEQLDAMSVRMREMQIGTQAALTGEWPIN